MLSNVFSDPFGMAVCYSFFEYISFLMSVCFSLKFRLSSFCCISTAFVVLHLLPSLSGSDTFLLEFSFWKMNGTNSRVRISLFSVISPRHSVKSLFLAYGSLNRPFEILTTWSFPKGGVLVRQDQYIGEGVFSS